MATTLGNGTITFGDGTTLSSASMIRAIYRGTNAGSTSSSITVTIGGTVNPGKCMVILNPSLTSGGGELSILVPILNSISTTTFQTSSSNFGAYSGYTGPLSFSWQVIEFY